MKLHQAVKHTACISLICCCWCTGGAGECESDQVQEDGSWAGRRRRAGRHRRVYAHQDQDQEQRQLRQRLLLSECLSGQMLRHPSPAGVSNALLVCVFDAGLQHSLSRPGEVTQLCGVRGQRWEGHWRRRDNQLSHSHVLEFNQETHDRLESEIFQSSGVIIFVLKNNCKHINLFITTSIYVQYYIWYHQHDFTIKKLSFWLHLCASLIL